MNCKKLILILVVFLTIFSINTVKAKEKKRIITNSFYIEILDDELPSIVTNEENEINSCEEALGPEIVEMIQSLVNIVRVGIPIALIVLGTIDFGKAAFSSDESQMKKAQGKFVKRLIIGISFFLIPVFIGILLKIGHAVWGDVIGTGVCGIEF